MGTLASNARQKSVWRISVSCSTVNSGPPLFATGQADPASGNAATGLKGRGSDIEGVGAKPEDDFSTDVQIMRGPSKEGVAVAEGARADEVQGGEVVGQIFEATHNDLYAGEIEVPGDLGEEGRLLHN